MVPIDMQRLFALLAALSILAAACSASPSEEKTISGDLPTATGDEILALVADDPRPAVINVWASWCGPCRSEAPLLREAHGEYGDRVLFIGVNIQDAQQPAKEFIAEFGLDFDHFFDPNREVPAEWGGLGVPLTYFVDTDGEILALHNGILDERTLVEGLEGLLADS